MNGPIRGGVATEGVSCFEDHLALDVFVRSPIGDGHGSAAGGSLENIDRLLTETGAPGTPGCSVLVTEDWVITSNQREELVRVSDELGGAVRPIKPLSSPVSYHVRGCL